MLNRVLNHVFFPSIGKKDLSLDIIDKVDDFIEKLFRLDFSLSNENSITPLGFLSCESRNFLCCKYQTCYR